MPNRWFHIYRENRKATVRAICFPYAGAGAQVFRSWAAKIPGHVEMCAVQYPGRWERQHEPAFRSVGAFVSRLVDECADTFLGRFIFFGHSLGALLAFETARLLHRLDLTRPEALVVSGRRAPDLSSRRAPIHHLPKSEFVKAIERTYPGGIPPQIRRAPEYLDLLLDPLMADMEMLETYTFEPGPPLTCPILALWGDQDETNPGSEVMGWRAQTTGSFAYAEIPGGHFFINTAADRVMEELNGVIPPA